MAKGTKKTTVKKTPVTKIEEQVKEKTENIEEKNEEIKETKTTEENVANENLSESQKLFNELLEKHEKNYEEALFEYCYRTDFPYFNNIVKKLFKENKEENVKLLPQIYINKVNEVEQYKGITFFSQLKRQNFEKVYSEDLLLLSLSEDDRKNRMNVLDILGYDPFKDSNPADRPKLYHDLSSMLTEAMRKDAVKANAAISIVKNSINIGKYEDKISELISSLKTDEETQDQLAKLEKVRKSLSDSNTAIAQKNGFIVEGVGNNGRGMLSEVMNQVGERGIDKGVTNFYDIATSKAIEEIANISFKAQLNQINLSKTDYVDILKEQRAITVKAQKVAREAKEALRLAKEKIVKQELLDELAEDYRLKGISEEDIEAFISREFEFYDIDNNNSK